MALDKATEYAAEDADVTLRLWQTFKPLLHTEKVTTVYETEERPLVPVLAAMEREGIKVDRDKLSRLSSDFSQRMAALEAEAYEQAGEEFKISSPKQLGEILFDKMGIEGGKKTKTGAWVTDADVLEGLAAEGHELPRTIVDWRTLSKLRSTYTEALAGRDQQGDRPRSHQLLHGRRPDRAPLVLGSEPSEHSGTDGRRPQDPRGLHRG